MEPIAVLLGLVAGLGDGPEEDWGQACNRGFPLSEVGDRPMHFSGLTAWYALPMFNGRPAPLAVTAERSTTVSMSAATSAELALHFDGWTAMRTAIVS